MYGNVWALSIDMFFPFKMADLAIVRDTMRTCYILEFLSITRFTSWILIETVLYLKYNVTSYPIVWHIFEKQSRKCFHQNSKYGIANRLIKYLQNNLLVLHKGLNKYFIFWVWFIIMIPFCEQNQLSLMIQPCTVIQHLYFISFTQLHFKNIKCWG